MDVENSLKKPIFIVGCMRSGTTLLAKLLGEHPRIIHCGFELKNIWSREGKVPMSSPKTHDKSCPSLDENDVRPGQLEQLTQAFHKRMNKVIKKKRKNKNGIFLNKNPHFCNKMPFLNALFPDARFIWIYRDLPNVVASMKKLFDDNSHYWPVKENDDAARCWIYHPEGDLPENIDESRFFPGGDAKYLAEYWYENNKAVSEFASKIGKDRLLIVKEDDLISNPRKVLSQCFQFLHLPNYYPQRLIRKIDSNRNSLWHQRLTREELQSLHKFVLEQGTKLDHIIPGRALFTEYKNKIKNTM
ncbi:sulfotransferase family protein [Scopulibacillus cellulosilyticus]|uniref:Sulfotransferase family protein n=1 Tax=Scopulibacillus cellulosilyticus TaxID=2665665 RepID=A0ABW2Q2W1_9BACL